MTGTIAYREGDRCEAPFLIIAGVAKAGTTSQFDYLAGHPAVAPCSTKSPFYFLPASYPSDPGIRYETHPLADYLALFPADRGQIRFEASPLYLHAPGTAELMAQVLPNARVVLSLRDPISRLRSFHQMAGLFGWIPRHVTFPDYVAEAFRQRAAGDGSPFYVRALDESLYADPVRHWQDVFGKARVMTILFDDFRRDPGSVMAGVADFAGADPALLSSPQVKNQNPARQFRPGYVAIESLIRRLMPPGSFVRRIAAGSRRRIEPLLRPILTRPVEHAPIPPATMKRLREFYAEDVDRLAKVLGRPLPWSPQYAGR